MAVFIIYSASEYTAAGYGGTGPLSVEFEKHLMVLLFNIKNEYAKIKEVALSVLYFSQSNPPAAAYVDELPVEDELFFLYGQIWPASIMPASSNCAPGYRGSVLGQRLFFPFC